MVDGARLAKAMDPVIGRTIDRVFVAEHEGGRFQVCLVFTDGTYYELYGDGFLSGAREVDRGDAEVVRAWLQQSGQLIEVGG